MKTGYVRRLGPGPDPVRPQGPVHQAAGPGPYLHGAGPTISGPDPWTSLWGPVRSEVRKGQDRTADSLRSNKFDRGLCKVLAFLPFGSTPYQATGHHPTFTALATKAIPQSL